MDAAPLLAAVGQCRQCVPVEPNTSLVFYQAASGAFAVLLLTGIAGEIRSIRDRMGTEASDDPMPRSLRLQLVGITVLLVLAMGGELLSLSVLLDPPPHKSEQIAVSILLATTVIGIPLLMLGSLVEYRPREFKRIGQAVLAILLVALVGVGLYLIAVAIEKNPKTYTYHVFGTCAAQHCGLNERDKPSVHAEPLGQLRDGDEVEIVCQLRGGLVRMPNDIRSRIWDKLDNGAYVSDIAVDTPPGGAPIPACEEPNSGSHHSG